MAGPGGRVPAAGPAGRGLPAPPAPPPRPRAPPDARKARIPAYGGFAARAERIPTVRRFLDSSGYGKAERRRIQGDASTRSYERLKQGEQQTILMNSPR